MSLAQSHHHQPILTPPPVVLIPSPGGALDRELRRMVRPHEPSTKTLHKAGKRRERAAVRQVAMPARRRLNFDQCDTPAGPLDHL
jgi:hypothetical protein